MLTLFAHSNQRLERLTDISATTVQKAIWIDLRSATDDEIALVESATGLHLPNEAALSEIETSSRLVTRDGMIYLSMPMLAIDEGGPRGVNAGFILSPQRLVTLRFATSRSFDTAAALLMEHPTPVLSGAHILIGILEAIVDRQADTLEQVRTDLGTMSRAIFAMGVRQEGGRKTEDAVLRRTLGRLGEIGDLISHAREIQVGAGRIVPYVEATAAPWLPKDLAPRLATLRQDIASISDFDTHLNDKLQFLLDATLGFINIAQNNVMKVMTIASVVGIPPVLIVGIYGMNFKNIHEYNWTYGYQWAWLLIILTTLLPLAVFRWRKWI